MPEPQEPQFIPSEWKAALGKPIINDIDPNALEIFLRDKSSPRDIVVNAYEPDYVTPPGDCIAELLEERAETKEQLAIALGIELQAVIEIISGLWPLTKEIIVELEKHFGVPASFWINRENNYRESLPGCGYADCESPQDCWHWHEKII